MRDGNGYWNDKTYGIINAARNNYCIHNQNKHYNVKLLWHKILMNGTTTIFKGNKSGYTHLLCFYALPVQQFSDTQSSSSSSLSINLNCTITTTTNSDHNGNNHNGNLALKHKKSKTKVTPSSQNEYLPRCTF